jgi:capsular polysaccharide export protein
MNNILIQCGDHYENQKRILPLALFLKNSGYNPIIIHYQKNIGNMFLENGIDTINIKSIEQSKMIRYKRIEKNYSLDYIYKGIKMSNIYNMDFLKNPYLFLGKKLEHRIKQAILKIDTIDIIINKTSPIYIFIWNGYTGIVANILREYSMVNNIKQAFLERGFFKNSVFIDSKGTNASSDLSKLESIPKLNIKYKYKQVVKDKSNFIQKKLIPSKFINKKIIFIPLQVQDDTNILLYSEEIKTMRQLVLMTYMHMNDDYICVVRPHPEEDTSVNLNLPILDRLIVTSDGDLKQWILLSSLIININSTVGLEAILENKKVICLGKSIYSNKGLTIDTNIREFNLDRIKKFEIDSENIKNYYNYLIEMHTCFSKNGTLWLKNNFPLLKKYKIDTFYNDRKLDVIKFNNYLKGYMDEIKKKLIEYDKVNIVVHLNNKNVNLTYRKNNIKIELKYILDLAEVFFLEKFQLKINAQEKINIYNYNSEKFKIKRNSFNILMIDEIKIKYEKDQNYHLIVDPYFNIHPLNLKFKGSNENNQ